MLGFAVWLSLLAAAGLCFPRRPLVTGALFILLGALSTSLSAFGGARPVPWYISLGAGGIWFSLGIRHLVKYRDPDARAAHVRQWTA